MIYSNFSSKINEQIKKERKTKRYNFNIIQNQQIETMYKLIILVTTCIEQLTQFFLNISHFLFCLTQIFTQCFRDSKNY